MAAKSDEIRGFIIASVREHPGDIVQLVAEKFKISRQAVSRHLALLVERKVLKATGETRNRRYKLSPLSHATIKLKIVPGLEEHAVWDRSLRPLMTEFHKNVEEICFYGFTEMFNNVIDHSGGSKSIIKIDITAADITIWVIDNGVGIFNKIAKAFHLPDARQSLLELSKGKLTTDPKRHTGEGIFFTSRAFDEFLIASGQLRFSHRRNHDDWLLEGVAEDTEGTQIMMKIAANSDQSLETIFSRFSGGKSNDYGFNKTHVPIRLAQFGTENLISRSQAKRVLNRFERFDEIILDFDGVSTIGQAFADEIFRVFATSHPDIKLFAVRTSQQVRSMIARAQLEAERQRNSPPA